MKARKRKGGRRPRRAGTILWGPSWMPVANLVARVWGTVDGGAELQLAAPGAAKQAWLPYDRHPDYATIHMGEFELWEIILSQLAEVEALSKAICQRWALAHDEDFLCDPDDVGYRARYLTFVHPGGSVIVVRVVSESVAQARRAAMQIYRTWAGIPRMAAADLMLFADDVLRVRESLDSAARESALPSAAMSPAQLMRATERLARLWGWNGLDDVGEQGGAEDLPIGGPVQEGPPDRAPLGIAEVLFFGRPLRARGRRSQLARQLVLLESPEQQGETGRSPADTSRRRPQSPQLMLPLSPVGEDEPVDHEWNRLFKGLLDRTVRAVMEDVPVESLVFHSRDYEPRGTRTSQTVSRYVEAIASGDRPWLHVRGFKGSFIVSGDYALLEAYRDSGLRFARCLILTKDRPE